MAHEHVRARRAAGITLAWLGCAGLTASMARAMTWDGGEAAPPGACVVSRISVDYDVDYDAGFGGYAVTRASLSGVPDDCAGREVALTLRGGDDRARRGARRGLDRRARGQPPRQLAHRHAVVHAIGGGGHGLLERRPAHEQRGHRRVVELRLRAGHGRRRRGRHGGRGRSG